VVVLNLELIKVFLTSRVGSRLQNSGELVALRKADWTRVSGGFWNCDPSSLLASSFMCIERPERMRNSNVKRNGPLKEAHMASSGHDTPEFPLTFHPGSWRRGVDVIYRRGTRIAGQL
jgi:hypothetical protein